MLASDSRFTVDLRRLRSDEARRDNYIRRNTLETLAVAGAACQHEEPTARAASVPVAPRAVRVADPGNLTGGQAVTVAK